MPGKRSLEAEDGAHTSSGTPSYISFNSVTQHDIWAPANISSSSSARKNEPKHRISHFIYALQFNPDPPAELLGDFAYLVAVVTAEHCLFLRVSHNGDHFEQFENFAVPDQPVKDDKKREKEDKEDIYTLQWIKDPINRRQWTAVAFAGSTGVIRLLDLQLQPQRVGFLRGHATAVNELVYCKAQPAFLLSGSKDHTIRLWSIKYLTCLAVFGGAQGHKAEIISLDVDIFGSYIVSGSYDSTIKIWNLFNPEHLALLDKVRIHAITSDPHPVTVPAACFSVSDVHDGQIDCVRWAFGGDKNHYVISKASDENILIWMPTLPQPGVPSIGTEWQLCHKMRLTNNQYWFVKFALWQNEGQHVLALGDDKGWIRLHDLQALASKQKGGLSSRALRTKPNRTSSPSKAVIRSVSFSSDGRLLIGGSDDGICHLFRRSDSPTAKKAHTVNNAHHDPRFETDDEDELDDDFKEC